MALGSTPSRRVLRAHPRHILCDISAIIPLLNIQGTILVMPIDYGALPEQAPGGINQHKLNVI